ncbi:hypothetical protein [Rhizobium sp. BK376]|uniref:hypothetical protein n=1 Tax=Rhizobium sp. BK376 TaxID=2512149 RepID=UPI00104AF7AE|nr:hypothetical protein [Rhizobium sp. BK376]TCR76778.1 hypothetical protein EV561_11938 [Rhizobium sp. BK376]
MSEYGKVVIEMVVWIGADGCPLADVEDRFTSHYSYLDEETGERRLSELTVGDEGIANMDLYRVVALGFSTAEYLAMWRYEEKTGRSISSEAELNALFWSDRETDPTTRQNRDEFANTIYVVSWVDDDGNPVRRTGDRFHSRFTWVDERKGTVQFIEEGIASSGMSGTTLRDAVTLGFNALEYKAMIEHERNNFELIQSEEELEALLISTPSTKP